MLRRIRIQETLADRANGVNPVIEVTHNSSVAGPNMR